jgi:nitrogen fixation NifU-like protein
MKIETTKITELSLDPSNVRKHSRRNIDAIKASLRKFGQQKPIVVDAKGIVLAGNGTLTAAQELGWTKIDITRTELTGVEATAFAIADNRTAELAEWEDSLPDVIKSLLTAGVASDDIGFSKMEIDDTVGTGMVGAPACGDVMKLQIKVQDGIITDAKFKTYGCGSAIASSSLVTEWVKGKTLDQAGAIKNAEIAEELALPPVKIHCSILAEDAIKAAVADYKSKHDTSN